MAILEKKDLWMSNQFQIGHNLTKRLGQPPQWPECCCRLPHLTTVSFLWWIRLSHGAKKSGGLPLQLRTDVIIISLIFVIIIICSHRWVKITGGIALGVYDKKEESWREVLFPAQDSHHHDNTPHHHSSHLNTHQPTAHIDADSFYAQVEYRRLNIPRDKVRWFYGHQSPHTS